MSKSLPLAVHTLTTKPWSFEECLEHYAKAGISGISVWKETLGERDPIKAAKQMRDAGLSPVSFVRGGFFASTEADKRAAAIEANRSDIRTAAALGCPMLVLVCGADPKQSPQTNLAQIRDGIAAVTQEAEEHGMQLAIEPLHPKYAGDRSAVSSMRCANELCDQIDHPLVGIAADVYHIWWEHDLDLQIRTAAEKKRLFAYHICDFKPDFQHPLLDRGLMGDGCIHLQEIDQLILDTGFKGYREVEIFSEHWWAQDQETYLEAILSRHAQIYLN